MVSENWSTAQILLDNGADPNIYQKGMVNKHVKIILTLIALGEGGGVN